MRTSNFRSNQRGFTLVELVIVMAVVALILSVVIPNLRGMQQEGQITKSEAELNTLKTAVVSYWRNNSNVYPPDVHNTLVNASPKVITALLVDPFMTDTANGNTYGYVVGSDSSFGQYFAIYSKGPNGDTTPSWDSTNARFTFSGSGRCVSNAPVVKQ